MGETSAWPLLSFSLHAQRTTWRADETEDAASMQRAVLWQGGVQGNQLLGTDMCPNPTYLHHGAPRGPGPGRKEDPCPEAWQTIWAVQSSPPAPGQGRSPSPLCQQPPTRALDLGNVFIPPLSHQPNHHGQNKPTSRRAAWRAATQPQPVVSLLSCPVAGLGAAQSSPRCHLVLSALHGQCSEPRALAARKSSTIEVLPWPLSGLPLDNRRCSGFSTPIAELQRL